MTEKTRITHIITGLATGGAETMLLKLLSGMDSNLFENSVISLTESGPIGDRIRDLGIPLSVLGMNRSIPSPLDLVCLYRKIRHHRPHVVQTWLYHADLLGFLAAKAAKVDSVAWNIRCSYMGKNYYKGMSGIVIKLLAAISNWPDTVIVNSAAGQLLHQSLGYHPREWQVIPNGFDTDVFTPSVEDRTTIRRKLGIPDQAPVIGLVGRWDPVKGHGLFLKVATNFVRETPEAHFIIVGKGCDMDNGALLDFVTDSLRTNLHLLGERHDIPAITAAFDLAVCASVGEGFPNVLGEAMACAVPCVATDVGDCAEIVADTGRIVPSGDVTAMTAAWSDLLSLAPSERKALGISARRRIKEVYSIENIISTYQNLYQGLRKA
jgi:glycosyltransferase involved in cell wall biosynthesis